jgi:hypothetical protein
LDGDRIYPSVLGADAAAGWQLPPELAEVDRPGFGSMADLAAGAYPAEGDDGWEDMEDLAI